MELQEPIFEQYLNDGQAYMLMMMPRDLVAECGRGFGKGLVQAGRGLTAAQQMEGSCGAAVCPSVKRGLTNIVPSWMVHWENWGLRRDRHYTVGKKPWKALGWKKPIFEPANWENTIAFYNGSIINLVSQDRSGTSNSLSLDYVILDEAKLLDFEQLKDETFQANRGNQMYFGKCYMHHGMTITSDTAMTKKGSWYFRYEEQMDPALVRVIEGLVNHIWVLKQKMKKHPERAIYYERKIRKEEEQLNFFRSKCLLYCKYSSITNLAVLGLEFVKRMKRELPLLTFMTSIMCIRVGISLDGFYGGMRESVNLYTAPNNSVLQLEALNNEGGIPNDCRTDGDLKADKPIIIAFDANALINWLVCGQVGDDGKLRVLKSFFVKYDRKLEELCEDFMDYYYYHRTHRVIFYYDSTFLGQEYASSRGQSFAAIIKSMFRRHQWAVREKYIGNPWDHVKKNELINRMFQGRAQHQVLINRDNNPDLLISIQSAGVRNGKKDKSGEKLAETEEDRLEARTDGSDAFDTLCIGVERYPVAWGRGGQANEYPNS